MHAAIRHDVGTVVAVDEATRLGRALTADLGRVPGFIACLLLDAGDGAVVSISICEDESSLGEVGRRLADWLTTRLAPAPAEPPRVISGEVIIQKGL